MRSFLMLGLIAACGLLCAVANAQQNYDGRNGPHVIGPPGEQVYIRGQNPGSYDVPGVGGSFQHSPGERVYTDERGNTYVNSKGGGGAGKHTVSGPDFTATRGHGSSGGGGGRSYVNVGPNGVQALGPDGRAVSVGGRHPRGVVVSRPDRTVQVGHGGIGIYRNRRDVFHVQRPDRTVDFSTGPGGSGFSVQRGRRSPQSVFHVQRPDRTVQVGGGGIGIHRNRRDVFHVQRPDRTVDFSNGPGGSGFSVQRGRRSPQRVTGENFAARGDRAGAWNDNVSVWKRPDGRTVTTDKDGNIITSGSPNGRGPQRYSGK